MRLTESVKLARYRLEYGIIGLKTGDINFSWRPEDVAGSRSAWAASEYSISTSSAIKTVKIAIPDNGETKSLGLTGKSTSKDKIMKISSPLGEMAYLIEELYGQPTLLFLSDKKFGRYNIRDRNKC